MAATLCRSNQKRPTQAVINREHDLSITKQAAALNISRGSVYYLSRPVSASDLEVMRRLDRAQQSRLGERAF